jgi:hypothetical protein
MEIIEIFWKLNKALIMVSTPFVLKRVCYEVCVGQTFLILSRFIENIINIYISE